MHKRKQTGLTLIELMVVVAIIGVLASVAVSSYQDYVAKVQTAGALSEISMAKVSLEQRISLGLDTGDVIALTGNTVEVLSLVSINKASSERCASYDVSVVATGTASIICTMKGGIEVEGKTIRWTRTTTGKWSCDTTVVNKLAPKSCPGV